MTIAGGLASQAIYANANAGTYTVTASANGAASVVFQLMNSLTARLSAVDSALSAAHSRRDLKDLIHYNP